jgi:hypothetical protein
MAIVKLSAKNKEDPSKGQRAVLFFTDEGTAYSTSRKAMKLLVDKEWRGDFIELTKLPIAVDVTRFRKSPVYDPPGNMAKAGDGKTGTQWDGLGPARKKQAEEIKQYTDKSIW